MKTRKSDVCVLCGKRPAVTVDHLPPKSIFPKPRPNDLITVPACKECNNHRSGLDEEFKVFIGINGGHGEEGEELFRNQTKRTLDYNARLKQELISTLDVATLKTPEGVIIGEAPVVKLNADAHDIIIEQMVRGFHFHHSGIILGDKVTIQTNWHRQMTKEIHEMTSGFMTDAVAGENLIYRYLYMPEHPYMSIWVFQFFNQIWSSGVAMPKEKLVEPAG